MHVPCGCENRKYIMFTQGNIGRAEVAIVGAAILILVAARYLTK